MWRILCKALLAAVLVTAVAAPLEVHAGEQDAMPLSAAPAPFRSGDNDEEYGRLLQQSRDAALAAPLSDRANLLYRQAAAVVEVRHDLAREWANELFALALQMKGSARTRFQEEAVEVLCRADPDRALELLHNITAEDAAPGVITSPFAPGSTMVARQVFDAIARRDGLSALPALEREADRMGLQGRYPYEAVGFSARLMLSKAEKQQKLEVLSSVFDLTFTRYTQQPRTFTDDFQFGMMLNALAPLPDDKLMPAVRAVVKNLLALDTHKYQFQLEVYTYDGQVAHAYNPIDASILYLLANLLNRDPDLTQQLQDSRPELRATLEYARNRQIRQMGFHGGGPPENQPEESVTIELDAVRVSRSNPDAGIALTEKLSADDGSRSGARLSIARTIAGDQPQKAADLIAGVVAAAGQSPSDGLMLNILAAQGYLAASQGRLDDLHMFVQRGFDVAKRVLAAQPESNVSPRGLQALVRIGIQNDPGLTAAFLQSVPPGAMKAELLLVAAVALRGERLPGTSTPK